MMIGGLPIALHLWGMGLFVLGIGVVYVLLMWVYLRGWAAAPIHVELTHEMPNQSRVAVVVPARNEAAHIGACLQAICGQGIVGTEIEVIVIDDHSTDDTVTVVEALINANMSAVEIRLLHLHDYQDFAFGNFAFKKRAIEYALSVTTAEIIVCTDADTVAEPNWLESVVGHFEREQVQFVAAPVLFHQFHGVLGAFQALDMCGMMGITAAGIHQGWQPMANGANMAFRRSAWLQAQKQRQDLTIPSGDDMFLVQAVAQKHPAGVVFAKSQDAVVWTQAQPTLTDLVQQRLRWGTKSGAYRAWKTQAALGVAWLICVLICVLALLGLVWPICFLYAGGLLLMKAIADFPLLWTTTGFWRQRQLMRWFVVALVLHVLYIAVVGTMSMFRLRYSWKGRAIRGG
jgi:cellulose synthase/poly-beta-1,6-N-acetylglucosamine synthase-like glycosyltransferase